MIDKTKLKFWAENSLNVLLEGPKGIGKSAIIINTFEQAGLKWKYFSAPTMDVWVDFVGVPKEVKDKDGNSYLELIKPKDFANDEVEAIFIDEFNRAPPKVLNAIMELLQFKSINGKKFNKLKVIWAAINPQTDGEENYSVNTIDPAQLDRFQVHVTLPYQPDLEYFKDQYGDKGTTAVLWWKGLSEENKIDVSPRRLEYAVKMFLIGGDVHDILPKHINTSELVTQLKKGAFATRLTKAFKKKDIDLSASEVNDKNFFNACRQDILNNDEYLEHFIPLLNEEKLSMMISSNKKVRDFFLKPANINSDTVKHAIRNLVEAGTTPKNILKELKPILPLVDAVYTDAGALYSDLKICLASPTRMTNTNSRLEMLTTIKAKYVDSRTRSSEGTNSFDADDGIHEIICQFLEEFLVRTNDLTLQTNDLDDIICQIVETIDSYNSFSSLFIHHFNTNREKLVKEFGETRTDRIKKYIDSTILPDKREKEAKRDLARMNRFA